MAGARSAATEECQLVGVAGARSAATEECQLVGVAGARSAVTIKSVSWWAWQTGSDTVASIAMIIIVQLCT